jgi:hypothetical protein
MATTADTVKQAGGGVSKKTDPASFQIEHFENAVMDNLVTAYRACEKDFPSMKHFLEFMGSDKSNANGPFPNQDLDHSMSNYFISSSHNTYLTGHQLYGKANVDGYKNVGHISASSALDWTKPLLCLQVSTLRFHFTFTYQRLMLCN